VVSDSRLTLLEMTDVVMKKDVEDLKKSLADLTSVVDKLAHTVRQIVTDQPKTGHVRAECSRTRNHTVISSSSSSEVDEWDPRSPEQNNRRQNNNNPTGLQYQRHRGQEQQNFFDQYRQHEQRTYPPYENEYGKYRLRLEIPQFNGHMRIEEVLDWLIEVERFFEVMEIPDNKKVKLVSVRFKSGASVWWEQVTTARARQQKKQVRNWPKMKKLIRQRFLPKDYQQVLFTQYQNCRQGIRTMEEYTLEFQRLSSRNDLEENEDQMITRYVGGLKYLIQDKMPLHTIFDLADAINMAERVEKSATPNSRYASYSTGSTKSESSTLNSLPTKKDYKGKGLLDTPCEKSEVPLDPQGRPSLIRCYKCQEIGHKSNVCPQKKGVHICDWKYLSSMVICELRRCRLVD